VARSYTPDVHGHSPAPPTGAVVIEGLVKRYGQRTAVDGLSLTIPAGTVTALLGPNGAGKTTTLECCEGFRTPDEGTVRVLGLDPRRDHRALAARCGVALQSGGAWSGVRAGELLEYVARLYAHPLPVPALMTRLGLDGTGRTPFRRLSGGQQQRLGVATAIVGRPEVVFLDEPTAGLDPAARHVVWDLVRELRGAGVTVVLCTHLMEEAEKLADLVVVVDAGRVVVADTPQRLTGAGAEDSVRFSGPPGLPTTDLVDALPVRTTVSESSPGAYVVRTPVTPDVLATLAAWCAAHRVLARDLSVGRGSLEDVFLELTGRRIR